MGQSWIKQTNITFHKNHGEDIETGDETAAVRIENRANCWSNGLVFSSEPIRVNTKIYVKLVVVSRASHDVISVGFTSRDPKDSQYIESQDKTTFWTFSLSRYFCPEDSLLCFFVNNSGIIHYGKTTNPQFKVLNKKVDVNRPMWAVFYIWSEPTTIKLLTPSEVRQNIFGSSEEVDVGLESGQLKRRVTKDAGSTTDLINEDAGTCIICFTSSIEVVFIPCGHLCSCLQCGHTIQRKDNLCPICRKSIGSVVRVYKS